MIKGKKIGVIVQARLSSSRLPRKVLLPLPAVGGESVISHVMRRVTEIVGVDVVVLATSDGSSDDELVAHVDALGYNTYRGSLPDVLSRYVGCAREYDLDVVVRVTGDCPCLDPGLVADAIESHLREGADYSSTAILRTFPHGMDVGIVNREALETAGENASELFEREHVMPYFYKSHPADFKLNFIEASICQNRPELRVTLDTPEDYALLNLVFCYFQEREFGLDEITALADEYPHWFKANAQVNQKQVHASLDEELNELRDYASRHDLHRASKLLSNLSETQS